jgi:hypothetical protein
MKYEEKLKEMVLVHKQSVNRMKKAHKKEIQ